MDLMVIFGGAGSDKVLLGKLKEWIERKRGERIQEPHGRKAMRPADTELASGESEDFSHPSDGPTEAVSHTTNTDTIRILWQSTPRLWMALRDSYDGAIDAKDIYGLGKTPIEALAHLLEQELEREPA